MNFLLWSGLFCLSFTWLFTLDLYTLERDAWWVALLVSGILCNSAACRGKITFNALDKKYSLLLIPLLLSLLILPFPLPVGNHRGYGRDYPAVSLSSYSFLLFSRLRAYFEWNNAHNPEPSGISLFHLYLVLSQFFLAGWYPLQTFLLF